MKTLDSDPGVTVPVIQFEKDGAEDAGLCRLTCLAIGHSPLSGMPLRRYTRIPAS